jgi:hypothetical protein
MTIGTITVVNKYKMPANYKAGSVIYIGRPSILGNPFVMIKDRDVVVEANNTWMIKEYATNPVYKRHIDQLVKELRQGHDVLLQCFCAPKRCHGDNIKRLVELIIADTEAYKTGEY